MATVFETSLIGNIGKDADIRSMDNGIVAINFPVAHNKNWKDKRTGVLKTKTTWVNCTIWKKDGANMKIVDYLKKGTLVDLIGTPFSKGYLHDDQTVRSEIRLNISKTNILRTTSREEMNISESGESSSNALHDFSIHEEEF